MAEPADPGAAAPDVLHGPAVSTDQVERIFRREYGRAVSVLVRVFGDIDIAEDAVQDAFAAALQHWPADGVPPSPAGWLITTARNRAIDRIRREASRGERHARAQIVVEVAVGPGHAHRWRGRILGAPFDAFADGHEREC